MAIITTGFETLINTFKADNSVTLLSLAEQSRDMATKWTNSIVNNEKEVNFSIDGDMNFSYLTEFGKKRTADISDTAFAQLCGRLGVPAKYVRKCIDSGKVNLAMDNFHSWADDFKGGMLVREYDGVARAVLSDSYAIFDSDKIIRALKYTVDSKKFTPAQVFLSPERLHIRFVNYEPIQTADNKSPIYAGFVVDSSDVGRGSLSVKFFLYRFACRNGMVIPSLGGTLFRLSHAGERMTDGKIDTFNAAFMGVDRLTDVAAELIAKNNKLMLKDYELAMWLEKARRDMKLSDKSAQKLQLLVNTTYEPTRWGFVNSVTELAQDFTLDTRIDMESWAGAMFTQKAA